MPTLVSVGLGSLTSHVLVFGKEVVARTSFEKSRAAKRKMQHMDSKLLPQSSSLLIYLPQAQTALHRVVVPTMALPSPGELQAAGPLFKGWPEHLLKSFIATLRPMAFAAGDQAPRPLRNRPSKPKFCEGRLADYSSL